MTSMMQVVVHGGAGNISEELGRKRVPYLKRSIEAAWSALCEGRPGEEAVASALQVMEGCGYFNAGYGGYPNVNGIVLLDVGLMKGNREFVSLINVRKLKHPSAAALDMLKKHTALTCLWTHELMLKVENASDDIKERYGLVRSHEDLISPYVRSLLEQQAAEELPQTEDRPKTGTVGCVVRDAEGRLFAGTSTGGIHLKHNGRVGDSPVIGAGVYADNEVGALSTSGVGEAIMASVLSGYILGEMRRDLRKDPAIYEREPQRLQSIVDGELAELKRKTNEGVAGVIIVPPRGKAVIGFNSLRFATAVRSGSPERIEFEQINIAQN